jgi:hypothetical protein
MLQAKFKQRDRLIMIVPADPHPGKQFQEAALIVALTVN